MTANTVKAKAVSLGSGVVQDTNIVYSPSKWAFGSSSESVQKPQSKQKKRLASLLRGKKSWRTKKGSTLSTTASPTSSFSESSSGDPVLQSQPPSIQKTPADRGLPLFNIDECTDDELLGGEMSLLDRDVEVSGVKTLIAALSAAEKGELTDPRMPIRHFRAENGDHTKSLKSLRSALEWRRSYSVDRLRTCVSGTHDPVLKETIHNETRSGKLYVRGTTKEGRALIYMHPMRNETPESEADNMKQLVWNIEKAAMVTHNHSQGRLEKYCLMINCHNYKLSKAPSMSVSKFTLDVLQKHYPERMYRAYVLNAPVAFRFFWNLIKNFIDPVTKAKVVFVSPNTPGLKQLYEDLGPIQVEKLEAGAFGTKPVRTFDVDEYLRLPMDVSFDE